MPILSTYAFVLEHAEHRGDHLIRKRQRLDRMHLKHLRLNRDDKPQARQVFGRLLHARTGSAFRHANRTQMLNVPTHFK